MEYGWYPVVGVNQERNTAIRVEFADGRALEVSRRHRVWVGDGWVEAGHLVPGDMVDGEEPGVVVMLTDVGEIDVMRITIETAHTYLTDGLLSHNMKGVDD
jgi:intein/homing endonuclease